MREKRNVRLLFAFFGPVSTGPISGIYHAQQLAYITGMIFQPDSADHIINAGQR